jgi:hypothetical protein
MPKFTLIAEHIDEDTCQTYSKVTHEFYHETLDEVVMSLQEFLRGVGYYFEGDLQIVTPARNAAADIVKATVDHSKYYYDTDRNR